MDGEELNKLKATFKEHLTEIGYARWKKHLVKCLGNMALKEARKEIIRFGNEIAQKEHILKIANG